MALDVKFHLKFAYKHHILNSISIRKGQ